jgi:type II secretory pathway pseudopilin PulG
MNCERWRRQRGTTLVEALFAVGLFGVAAAAIVMLLVGQIRQQGANMLRTSAITLAERELEDLRTVDYARISSRSLTKTIGGMTYTVGTTVLPDTPAASMKTISTVVTWTEPNGPQSYALSAIYTSVKR